jgi:lactate dehydrogenase-like 2-hydroxyacid dehydrogenase
MFYRLPAGALLVNVGRGSLVDEDAVADSLRAGHLGGYGVGVFAFEDWSDQRRPREISPALLAHERNASSMFAPASRRPLRRMPAKCQLVEPDISLPKIPEGSRRRGKDHRALADVG